jgi:hypothetical protein
MPTKKTKTMKQLYSILLGLFISATIATAQNNSLIIYSNEGVQFTVIINGVRQNMQPETNVKVTGLNSQNYQVKLIFANNKPDLNKTIWLTNGADKTMYTDYTYGLDVGKDPYKLRFKSAAPSSSASVTQQNVIVYHTSPLPQEQSTSTVVTTPGSSVTTTTNVTETTVSSNNPANVDVSIGGIGINVNIPTATSTSNQNVTTTSTTTTTTSSSTLPSNTATNSTTVGGVSTTAATVNNCSMSMTTPNFEAAKKSIQAKNFDDSKLIIAKQILDNNCLKCSQIKELMGLFSFEASKLEIAKHAWHRVVDKGNYFTINDAFTFDSSVDELNEYTKSH